ncbi:MAG: hypothetical protein JXK08_04170 [Flavobacteriaceae bacterium]|nr:hypothetical protein [Flavobacteriaceae bacterium]
MKKFSLIALALIATLFTTSCENEETFVDKNTVTNADPNFRVTTANGNTASQRASYDEPCMTTNLIAGQNHIAGTVSVDFDGVDLIITYTTNGDWSIQATHLSIGNCAEQTIPTTGSGNPKIGHFEHSTTHNPDVDVVAYYIDPAALTENYCFAAHAEVNGPTGGETAWAEGTDFDGNSWAMYVEALLSDCNVDDPGNDR